MDQRNEVGEFLRSRRDKVTPEQAGIIGGGRRRVPGLRREEVATPDQTVRPSLQRFFDAITGAPVWVRDRRMNIITANPLGRALNAPILHGADGRGNTARFVFLSPAARGFFPDWDEGADDIVATLRTYAGQNPRDKLLTDLIGELVTRSDAFRLRWGAHNVRHHRTGIKRICHPEVGDLELTYEALELPANPDWSVFGYTAEPGSATEDRLKLLGSLAATTDEESAQHGAQRSGL